MAGEPEQHTTITIPEIADRLDVCEETVYDMLKQHEIPNIRHGRRFIVSRAAYEKWEATIGEKLPDIHRNLMPGCREIVRKRWSPEYEEQLAARDELREQLLNLKKAEPN